MREGLRSSTVSQRSGTESVRKRDRADSRNEVKLGSDVGLSGNCDRVRNILPDLNAVANPSEFDSDWPFEGGYGDDGGELAEKGGEGFVADESIKQKGIDTAYEGEIGKDLMQSCSVKEQKFEQEVHEMIDMNVDALECDESAFSDLCAAGDGEEETVLEKDKIGDVDQILQQNTASILEINSAACTEHNGPAEPKMENYSIDLNVRDDSNDLLSNSLLPGSCSENVISTIDSPRDMDIDNHKTKTPEKEKLQIGVKVLRSRVIGSGLCSENSTCSMGNSKDMVDTVNPKMSSPEEDKLQVGGKVLRSRVVDTVNQKMGSPEEEKLQTGGKVLRSRVVVAVTREGQTGGCSRRKTATSCSVNESATSIDISKEQFDGSNKKHKGIPGIFIEEENSSLKTVLHGEEAFVEEVKNDESNDVQNKRDDDCLGSLREKEENADSLNNMIEKDETAAEVPKKKVGRGRPRKQHGDSVSTSLLLKNIKIPLENGAKVEEGNSQLNDGGNELYDGQKKGDDDCLGSLREKEENADSLNNMIEKDETAAEDPSNNVGEELVVVPKKKVGRGRPRKQHGDSLLLKNIEIPLQNGVNGQLTNQIDKQQKGRPGKLKKRKRGRPKKIDKEMDEKKLNQHDWEGTDKAGKGRKKQGRRKFAKGTKNLSGKGQIHVDEAELNIKKGKDNEVADAADNVLRAEGLMKRKRGRPKKIKMENDAPEPIPGDQEGAIMVKEENHHFAEGSKKRLKKQILEGAEAEVKASSSGTAPLSSLRLKKRKRKSTEEEGSKGESKMSPEGKSKVKNSSTREEKSFVRQQIVDMLISAGWTVEYKPRQGKDYADSVYRSPEGKTHWSVTLAYRVLKHQVETGKAVNFCFTPIPDEKLSTLFRIQVKARSDKNTQRQNCSGVKLSGTGKCKGKKKMDTNSLSKRKSGNKKRRGCALLVRGSKEFMAISGKQSILSWMIESGAIQPGGKVYYRRRTKVILEGSITKDGINCNCCSKIHSVAEFESHAGNKSCPLYQNLYLDSGSSLLQSQMELWNKQEESIRLGFHKVNVDDDDPNDDTCGICGDGGNLICCDGCPSTFHQACLNILNFPSGDWHCVYCSCKYCETAGSDVDQDNTSSVLLTCCLCDGKYHHLCAYEKEGECGLPNGPAFCGKICEQIYERFQQFVGVKAEVGDGYTCTFIKRPESQDIISRSDSFEPKEVENMSKLAVALSVMDECFLPIIDHRSGINLMRHTLYSCGSNFKRLNFRGFFTAILEKEDEIIAAASIRIHGKELAEMPFIGTRNAYRRQGMCRRLLSGIELALCSLAIEKLVIPAVSEVIETWTSVFGFEPLGGLGSEMRHMNVLVFPGVDMLQKPLDQQTVTSDREAKDIKPDDFSSKSHAEEDGCIETKAEDGCLSEKYEPSIEELQDSEKLSSENGPLEFVTVDQEQGNNTEIICSDTDHKAEGLPDGASDHMVSFAEKHVLVDRLNLTEIDAREPVQPNCSNDCPKLEVEVINPLENDAADLSLNSLCNGHLSTSVNDVNNPVEDTHDSTCPIVQKLKEQSPEEGTNTEIVCSDPDHTTESNHSTPVKDDELPDKASDHMVISSDKPVLVTNLNLAGNDAFEEVEDPKLEVEVINPSKNGATDPPSTVNDVGNPVEDINDLNDAQVSAKTQEHFESDLQIDCNTVTQFNLEKSCNMDSGTNDLATPVPFHACSAPEV